MKEASKIVNAKEDSLGHKVQLNDLTESQMNQIKTTSVDQDHWLKVHIYVFSDESYILVETNKI